ncbi:MAG: galactose-1-phosphate uridylyltransferase [Planctomycetes bacterium]|nr:galactose-1-phosphate uridylyltransferase [Planctomycetota bacterium]
MPELRQNIATNEWVIIATERAKRPEEFKKSKEKTPLPEFNATCPFCPGNEGKTPPASLIISDGTKWAVRVMPNKFAALSPEGDRVRKFEGIKRSMAGVGIHEVIVETQKHNITTALLPEDHIAKILSAYQKRYQAVSQDTRMELIILFKNHGEAAGTSLEHPHSQLVATPIMPSGVRTRMNEAIRYFDVNGECVFCKMLQEELRMQERVVLETDKFVSFIPYAAFSPFHIWTLPKRHTASFGEIAQNEITDLSVHLKSVLGRIYHGLGDPDFNYVVRSANANARASDYFHWYISIVPRLTKAAGFELGSGMFINIALPEQSAQFLKNVSVPK